MRDGPVGVEGLPIFAAVDPPWKRFGDGYVDAPRARLADPETSHQAARDYHDHAEAQNAQIVSYLVGRGARGATAGEIEQDLGWDKVTASRRISALRRAGLLVTYDGETGTGHLSPEVRRATPGRRSMCVHVAAEWGLPVGRPPELEQGKAA